MTEFNRERIPERVVHAKSVGLGFSSGRKDGRHGQAVAARTQADDSDPRGQTE